MLCPKCHRQFTSEAAFCPYDGNKLSHEPRIRLLDSIPPPGGEEVLSGRYKIKGMIGQGAMAKVYLAEDLKSGEAVAVKVLSAPYAFDTKARTRFLNEAEAAARIGHPSIVRVFGSGERADRSPYLVMEFLFGESLGDLLKRVDKIPCEGILPLMRHAASGFAAAHAMGIVHRDIKPDNIFLIGAPGDPYAVKIVDFGLAKLADTASFTGVGVAIGTVAYMAPEQVVTDPVDARSDVYGLGCVLFRAICGKQPFPSRDDVTILASHLVHPMPVPSASGAAADPGLDAIILKATRKSPDNRYQRMEDFLRDIDRLLQKSTETLEAIRAPGDLNDVYTPKTAFAEQASAFFYRRAGATHPILPT